MPPGVWIHYHTPDASHQFALQQGSLSDQDPLADWSWAERVHDGERILVSVPEDPRSRIPTRARVERDGTRITIESSDLDLETLLRLVDSLVPAPTAPPPLAAE